MTRSKTTYLQLRIRLLRPPSSVNGGLSAVFTASKSWTTRKISAAVHFKGFRFQVRFMSILRPTKLTVAGFEQLNVCSTGFSGIDLLHVAKVVQLMGKRPMYHLSGSVI